MDQIEIKGKVNTAICYARVVEEEAIEQIRRMCDYPMTEGSRIRIMPDVHAGKGCTIGTTMTIRDKAVPNVVGVDIGCGMYTVNLGRAELDFAKIDEAAHVIPSGMNVWEGRQERFDLMTLACSRELKDTKRLERSLGTLGGGNHFIEADRSDTGDIYIVVHSGSRHLGVEVADYYQEQGRMALWGGARYQIGQLIETLKSEGRFQEIQPAVTALKKEHKISIPKDLAYVEGKLFEDYIHDMRIVQHFAVLNRKAMMDVILSGMGFTKADEFTTIHNYIDTDAMILRKGSVSAKKGEKLLIPINMRDGSLICIGKGNPEWNCSAPHGAGRLMSRRAAFSTLSMEQYRKEMKGIYSTCVVPDTLDESPMAYKSMEEIIAQIEPTAQIAERVKPVYNFKAAE